MADSAAFDKRAARTLDKVLSGSGPSPDPSIARLVDVADRLRDAFNPEMPDFRAQRAMFVQAVGSSRKGFGWLRFFGPATVAAIALVVAIMMGRSALPGQAFYPVRQALRAVGLAPFSLEEVDQQLVRAKALVARAEDLATEDPEQARAVAFEAVKVLGFAEELLPEVAADQAEGRITEVKALLLRAQAILVLDDAERRDQGQQTDADEDDPGFEDESGGSDNKGTVGGGNSDDDKRDTERGRDERDEDGDNDDDDDGDEDNSGPGSGDKDADDDGKDDDDGGDGEDDGDGDEDNSGPGSGGKDADKDEDDDGGKDTDKDEDEDNSGPGGGGRDDKSDDKDSDGDGDADEDTPDGEPSPTDLKEDKDPLRHIRPREPKGGEGDD